MLSRVRWLSLLVMTAGEQEEEEDGGDSKQEAGGDACAPGQFAVFTEVAVEITQSRYKRVRFHFVRWLVVGQEGWDHLRRGSRNENLGSISLGCVAPFTAIFGLSWW